MRFFGCFKDRNFINNKAFLLKIQYTFLIDKSQISKCHCKTDVLTACANGPILLFIDPPLANMQTSISLCHLLDQGIFQ